MTNMKIDNALLKAAEEYYDQRLAYHNFSHIHFVFAAADTILERCRRHNVIVNEDVVCLALLFHDAGFMEDHTVLGFESKEAYSAHIAGEVLGAHDIDPHIIDCVKQAILCTHCDGHCASNEDRAVRAADLSGLAADYGIFRDNAIRLKSEYEFLNRGSIDWQSWKDMAIDRLLLFLREDMELTDEEFDEQGDSLFRQAVLRNVERLRQEPEPR